MNEELLLKIEQLNNAIETLNRDMYRKQRELDESHLRVKEIKIDFETQIRELDKKQKQTCIDMWKKEALMAKITT